MKGQLGEDFFKRLTQPINEQIDELNEMVENEISDMREESAKKNDEMNGKTAGDPDYCGVPKK